ncbi:hypothetical protein KCV07_g455, partial [Aureobasidium melanogenum]
MDVQDLDNLDDDGDSKRRRRQEKKAVKRPSVSYHARSRCKAAKEDPSQPPTHCTAFPWVVAQWKKSMFWCQYM